MSNGSLKGQYLSDLIELNKEARHDDMADLMICLEYDLTKNGHLTEQLIPTKKGLEEEKEIVNIFLNVRREFQKDHEAIQDFSYISVAWDWLRANQIKTL